MKALPRQRQQKYLLVESDFENIDTFIEVKKQKK